MAQEKTKADDPKSKKVLIVDDDESVLNLLEILVKRDGFRILLASNGEEAVSYLDDAKPDAAILDLMLPGHTSGFGVLKHLRERNSPAPPVIVVTAFLQHKEIEEVKADPNVAAFIPKPINQDQLLGALHGILRTKSPHPPREPRQAPPAPPPAPEGGAGPKA